ncbi:MAG: HAMP domain-containing histidine kinase [Prevotella sp.]|nr:HAMP domain-containing histidine kinase [Prevotella sp.]
MNRKSLLTLLLVFLSPIIIRAQKDDFVLIITSFQIELNNYQTNISEFYTEINRENPDMQYVVENMNCRSLSEMNEWRERMGRFVAKYEEHRPRCILLLGNEAWASYLSLNNDFTRSVPCFAMLVNDRIVQLPDTAVNVMTWHPQMRSFSTDMPDCSLKGAIAYHYDVKANVELAQRLFPKTRRINFFTDNTFGGINQLGLINDYVDHSRAAASQLVLRVIDGRSYTFNEAGNEYRRLRTDWDLAMFTTWRIDSTGNYLVVSATQQLLNYNRTIPGISVTSTGIGDVSIGGIIPRYGQQGRRMGQIVNRWLRTGQTQHIISVDNVTAFDYTQLRTWNITPSILPKDADIRNKPHNFYESHPQLTVIFTAITVILILSVAFFTFHIFQNRRNMRRQKEMMIQLAAAKEKAEEANRLKSNFLANMSHEVRTPLNVIVGFANILIEQRDELSETDFKEISTLINQNAELLVKLVNDVLDLSRIESRSVQMTPEDIDLIALGRSLVNTESLNNSRKANLKVLFDCPHEELSCVTDRRYLQQIIINLLNNAIKFTDKGTVTLRIEQGDDCIRFSVTDTGPGIPTDKQKLVFQRFEQLDNFKQGTGLGLSICQSIVEMLGGRIWIDPEYIYGARFMFTIPQ